MQEKPQNSYRTRRVILYSVVAAIVTLMLVAGILLLLRGSKPEATGTISGASGKNSITMYYRDGKTVLWSSTNQSTENAEPGFAQYVRRQLADRYSNAALSKGEWRVTTSLDRTKQQSARTAIASQKDQLAKQGAKDGVFIAQEANTGRIVSWVNSWDAAAAREAAEIGKLQVGTLMLPLLYASVLDNTSATIDTTFSDTIGPLPGYPCTERSAPNPRLTGNCLYDFDYKFMGDMTIRQALGNARLVPAVRAALTLDPATTNSVVAIKPVDAVMKVAGQLGSDGACYQDEGLTHDAQCYTSALFGSGLYATPGSLVDSFATLVNHGARMPATSLLRFTLNGTESVEKKQKSVQTVKKATADAITTILKDQQASYMNTSMPGAFTTPGGVRVGTMTGVSALNDTYGMVQFDDQYVAGFWTLGKGSALTGSMERPAIAVLSSWTDAAR